MKATSPLSLACTRLVTQPLACTSLVVILIVVVLCFGAPLFTPHQPETQHLWVGALPPLSEHPALIPIQETTLGEEARLHPSLSSSKKLEFHLRQQEYRELRVALHRGMIHRMFWVEGAIAVEQIDVSKNDVVRQRFRDSTIGPDLPSFELKMGSILPPQLDPSHPVLFLRLYSKPVHAGVVSISLERGVIKELTLNGEPLTDWRERAENILKVVADGKIKTIHHLLGTDSLGRDLFSRVLHGGQISLMVGAVATLVSLIIGLFVGSIAAVSKPFWDRFIMAGVDVLYAIPFMFLVILLLSLFSRSLLMLFVALGAVQWLTMSRIVRTQVKSTLHLPYVDAARLGGAGLPALLSRHVLPNIAGPVIIYCTITVPAVILEESFLAFIGLTVQFKGRSLDSWGSLVHQGMQSIGSSGEQLWILAVPSLAMVITLLALNFLGDGMRDALDPKDGHG